MKKTTITITKELHRRARQYALDNETSVSELVRESLAARLDNSQVRYYAYPHLDNDGVWMAKIYDKHSEQCCFSVAAIDEDSDNTKWAAEDIACAEANRLEEQYQMELDHDDAITESRGCQ